MTSTQLSSPGMRHPNLVHAVDEPLHYHGTRTYRTTQPAHYA